MFARGVVKRFLAVSGVLARRCPACGGVVGRDGGLCAPCAVLLAPRTGGFCPRCGNLFGDGSEPPMVCVRCRTEPPPWDGLAFHGAYEGLLRELILGFKFEFQLDRLALLRDLLVEAFRRGASRPDGLCSRPDLIVPAPLHPRRLRWRGFNQSLELAVPLADGRTTLVVPDALIRVRHTVPQSSLSGGRRRENVKGAFRADPSLVAGRAVLLADDVMTTGATLEEAALALKAAGAIRTDVIVLAR